MQRSSSSSLSSSSSSSPPSEDVLTIIARQTRTSIVSEPKLPLWMYVAFFSWCLLSAWFVVDVIAGSTFHDNDLALAALALLVASAIAGSRLFLWIRDYKQHRNAASQ